MNGMRLIIIEDRSGIVCTGDTWLCHQNASTLPAQAYLDLTHSEDDPQNTAAWGRVHSDPQRCMSNLFVDPGHRDIQVYL
jgi:hypothetical protein